MERWAVRLGQIHRRQHGLAPQPVGATMIALMPKNRNDHDDPPRRTASRQPALGAALTRPGMAPPQPILRLVADRRIRYLFAGGIAAAVFYGTFAGTWLLMRDQVPYLVVVLFASIVTALATYPIYRVVVFNAFGPWLSGFFRFYAVSLWGLGFNLVALPFLVEIVHLHVLISQAIVILAGPLISYQLHRRWTFRPGKPGTVPVQAQVVPSPE